MGLNSCQRKNSVMIFKRLPWLFITALIVFSGLKAHGGAEDPAGEMQELMDAYVGMGSFSGSVMVAKEGEVLFHKAYGKANHELEVPQETSGKFRIGPVSKAFTALLIHQLANEGELSLDDPVEKYAPEIPASKQIEIQHLLTHSSGLPDIAARGDFETLKKQSFDPDYIIQVLSEGGVAFEPGETHQASKSDYLLLGYIIEEVTGKSYREVLNEKVLGPLELDNTGYYQADSIIKNRVSGYTKNRGRLLNAPYLNNDVLFSAGGIFSTTGDLQSLATHLMDETLIEEDRLEEMWSREAGPYGLGWVIEEKNGLKTVGRQGSIDGFASNLAIVPDEELKVVVLGNYDTAPVDDIGDKLINIAMKEDYNPPENEEAVEISKSLYDLYSGSYILRSGLELNITREGDRLFAQIQGQPEFEIYPVSNKVFHYRSLDASITFETEEEDRVIEINLRQNGDKETGEPKN